MNITELAHQAIERINSMSSDELRDKFIEHGYKPKPMDDENEFTQGGKTFVTEDAEECPRCHFYENGCVYRTHPCAPTKRADGRSIIWVKKDG